MVFLKNMLAPLAHQCLEICEILVCTFRLHMLPNSSSSIVGHFILCFAIFHFLLVDSLHFCVPTCLFKHNGLYLHIILNFIIPQRSKWDVLVKTCSPKCLTKEPKALPLDNHFCKMQKWPLILTLIVCWMFKTYVFLQIILSTLQIIHFFLQILACPYHLLYFAKWKYSCTTMILSLLITVLC